MKQPLRVLGHGHCPGSPVATAPAPAPLPPTRARAPPSPPTSSPPTPLSDHFRHDHYLCPHPSCLEKKFVVFAGEQELKQHTAR